MRVRNRRLARHLRKWQGLPGQELFQYENDEGEMRAVTSTDVNAYLHDCLSQAFSAKDFRTWGGTVVAAFSLVRQARSRL